jgi:hypothetical protein
MPPLDPVFVEHLVAFAEDRVARDIRFTISAHDDAPYAEATEGDA